LIAAVPRSVTASRTLIAVPCTVEPRIQHLPSGRKTGRKQLVAEDRMSFRHSVC
jgi:hypothetical protein